MRVLPVLAVACALNAACVGPATSKGIVAGGVQGESAMYFKAFLITVGLPVLLGIVLVGVVVAASSSDEEDEARKEAKEKARQRRAEAIDREEAEELAQQARDLARVRDCTTVRRLSGQVAEQDEKTWRNVFGRDRAIKRCLDRNRKPEPSAEEKRDKALELTSDAAEAAGDGDCETAIELGKRIAALDSDVYVTEYSEVEAIQDCFASPAE